jgi:hypothetical protein
MQRNGNSKLLRVIALSELLFGGIVFFLFGQSRTMILASIILCVLAAYSWYRSYHQEE